MFPSLPIFSVKIHKDSSVEKELYMHITEAGICAFLHSTIKWIDFYLHACIFFINTIFNGSHLLEFPNWLIPMLKVSQS